MNSRTTLATSLSLILEDAVFIFAELSEEAPEPFDAEIIQASLNYEGDHSGTLYLRTTVPFALQLAEEMMVEGDENELPEEVIGEILNIVAGLWVVEHFGERTLFSLSPPETERVTGDVGPALDEDSAVLITDDGDRIDFLMAA